MRPRPIYPAVRFSAFLITVVAFLTTQAVVARANPAPQNSGFSVPQWTSLRIRMDDTLTSRYSMEGDPFSATVMDDGLSRARASTARSRPSTPPAASAGTPP